MFTGTILILTHGHTSNSRQLSSDVEPTQVTSMHVSQPPLFHLVLAQPMPMPPKMGRFPLVSSEPTPESVP